MSKTECLAKMPITLKDAIANVYGEVTYEIMVPCGKCERCLDRRKREWGFRMEEEMKQSKTAYFVTLTYNRMHVPYDKFGNKILLATREKHLRNEMAIQGRKRLTKKFKRENFDLSLQGFLKRVRQNLKRGTEGLCHRAIAKRH